MPEDEVIDLDEMPVVTMVSSDDAAEPTTTKKAAPAAAGADMPTHSKLAHTLAIIVAGVIAVAVAIVLADGTSVIRLKDPQYLPIATNPALKSQGLNHRLDVLLGPTYGVGLHHDQAGHAWTSMAAGKTLKQLESDLSVPVIIAALPSVISTDDLKHPVPFLKCERLQMAGLAAMSMGFIAEVVAVLMLILHTLMLSGLLSSRVGKPLASLIWFVLAAGFCVVIFLAVGVYSATWTCDNTFIPQLRLSDHFNYNYGFAFAIVGFASSLLIFFITLSVTSTQDGAGPVAAPSLCAVLATVVCGLVLCLFCAAFGAMFVAAANGAYAPQPAAPDVNPCEGKKPYHADSGAGSGSGDNYFSNVDCMRGNVVQVLEQAGGNVTKGFKGGLDAGDRVPITGEYSDHGLCPVNVHWHLGAEHLSVGQYDSAGSGPAHRRQLAGGNVRQGFQCHHYDSSSAKFTTPYTWKHCTDMEIGQTYEIHWPHSAAGACGTKYQYQTPFYDGVFCRDGVITIAPLNTYEKIGVQAQIFTIVNDEEYYHDNLINGALTGGDFWSDVAKYTGSTTGTSRDNLVCSRYTPVTWQVDRKCHKISASSFDKLCKDMKAKEDDMSGDLHPHGARTLVAKHLTANNQQSRK